MSGSSSVSSTPSALFSETSLPSQIPTETGRFTLPISHYTFTSFQTPTQSAVPGVFPWADPKHPPPVHSDTKVVPDFVPAWTAAYEKAKAKVRF